jgi:CubicO group peptidase (beta-lactamase class C family)
MSLYAFIPLLTGQLSQNKPNLDLLAAQPLGISRDINSFPSLNGLAGRPRGDGAFSGIDALLALVGKGEEPGAKPGKLIPREIEGGKVFVLDDFENPDLSNNWTLTGDSFRSGRSFDGATYNQRTQDPSAQIKGFEGKQFAFSFEGRNSYTGKAVSKEFTIDWDQISFDIMGGTSNSTRIELVVVNDSGTEQAVRTATGDGTLNFSRKNWNVKSYKGKTAKLVITDDSAAASYGFIGVDNIRGEGEASPAVVGKKIPGIDFNNLPYQGVLSQMTDQWRSNYNLPGVWCAYIKGGRVVACVASGTSNIKSNIAADVNDYLGVGSVSKVVTGSLIAALISEGKASYTTTVADVFPELARQYPDSPLLLANIGQLLTHTAGLPRAIKRPSTTTGVTYRKKLLDDCLNLTTLNKPGTNSEYSNLGPTIAVAMLEKLTSASYEDWLEGDLGKSFGLMSPRMLDTYSIENPHQAVPHLMDIGNSILRTATIDDLKRNPQYVVDPSGGCSLSLVDLTQFCLATIRNSPGFNQSFYNQLIQPASFDPKGHNVAGWSTSKGGALLVKDGNTGRGEFCITWIDVRSQSGFVFYTNACTTNPSDATSNQGFMSKINGDIQSLLSGR